MVLPTPPSPTSSTLYFRVPETAGGEEAALEENSEEIVSGELVWLELKLNELVWLEENSEALVSGELVWLEENSEALVSGELVWLELKLNELVWLEENSEALVSGELVWLEESSEFPKRDLWAGENRSLCS